MLPRPEVPQKLALQWLSPPESEVRAEATVATVDADLCVCE